MWAHSKPNHRGRPAELSPSTRLTFGRLFSGDEDLEVDVMIGADYYWSIVQNHVVRGKSHGLVAVCTRLGYVLSGPINVPTAGQHASSVNISHVMKTECQLIKEDFNSDDVSLKEELSKFWDNDTLGVKGREEEFYEDYLTKVRLLAAVMNSLSHLRKNTPSFQTTP